MLKKKNKGSVCIIGLGFVGLTLSTVMANRGFRVYGVEKNSTKLVMGCFMEFMGSFMPPKFWRHKLPINKKKVYGL